MQIMNVHTAADGKKKEVSGFAGMPYMTDQMAAPRKHSLISLENGEAGRNGHIERIKQFVCLQRWRRDVLRRMIRQDKNTADVRMSRLCSGKRAQDEAIEAAMMTNVEFCHAVFRNVLLDCAFEGRKDGFIGIGMTDEEAGFCRHEFAP
ncbi:MAG: hypothetical protein IJN79_00780 [Clostridia bacterium]|nr:hypothetical protein [Clostridia bacterium]